jgi:uncharacterized protein (DUF433 family)
LPELVSRDRAPDQEILEELPDLTEDDIAACIRFARQRIDRMGLARVVGSE